MTVGGYLDHPMASHSVLKVDGIICNIITNFGKAIGKYLALYLCFLGTPK